MAKRRTRRASSSRAITVRPAAPQIIRVSGGGGGVRRRRSGRRRHGGGHGGFTTTTLFNGAMGGALLGFVDTAIGTKLPTIPMLGRAGTIALGCYLLGKGKGHGMLRDMAIAAAAVAGYEIGTKGSISGVIPAQVRGIAAQI